MTTEIGNLVVALRAETAAFRTDLAKANRSLQRSAGRMSRQVDQLNRQFVGLGRTLRRNVVGGLQVLAAATIARGFSQIIGDAVRLGEALTNTAQRVGVTVEELQELRAAAATVGVEASTVDMALQRFARRVGEAAAGGGVLHDVLRENDIALRDANGEIRDQVDILADFADAIENAGSEQEQLLLAFQAFDSEGATLVNLLREGADGLDELRERAEAAGLVLGDEQAQSLSRINDEWRELIQRLQVDFASAVAFLEPLIRGIIWLFEQLLTAIEAIIETIGDMIDQVANALIELSRLQFFPNVDREVFREMLRTGMGLEGRDTNRGAGTGTGGTTPGSRTTERDPFQEFIDSLHRQQSALTMQRIALNTTAARYEELRIIVAAGNVEAELNAELTEDQRRQYEPLRDVIVEITQALEDEREALRAANDAAREVEQQNQRLTRVFTNFAQSAITDVDNVGDAFERLAGQLADLILEMTVFEQIRSGLEDMDLFGSGSGSGGGGLFGAIGDFFGGLFAEGGRPPLGRASIVGEEGPEWFFPDVAGTIVPMDAIGGGGGGPAIVNHIDARGAERGTAIAIEQAVNRAVQQSVVAVQQMAASGRMRDRGFS